MDYRRDLLLSLPVALLLMIFTFFAFSSPTTIQVQNVQLPLSGTQRGFPLAFQYQYNCPVVARVTYCSTATPPLNNIIPKNPSGIKYTNGMIDYVFWFVISALVIIGLDALTWKRFAEQPTEEKTLTPEDKAMETPQSG